MLALQEYLLNNPHSTNEEIIALMDKKGIDVSFDLDCVLFKYRALNVDFTDPVVKECRGIILYRDDFSVACYPFNKFGNYSESYADDIDWSTARVQEKLDGSIIKLWYHKYIGSWIFSTNGTIDANHAPHSVYGDFQTAIKKTKEYQTLIKEVTCGILDRNYTYMFEYISPNNTIVIKYPEDRLIHIGTRNNITFKEYKDVNIGIEKPKEYPITSLDDCIKFVNDICTPEERHEGCVVVDGNYNRIKVKNMFYIKCHYLMGKMDNPERICEFFDSGDIDEIGEYVPEFKPLIHAYKNVFAEFKAEMSRVCTIAQNLLQNFTLPLSKEDNKSYALRVKDNPYSSYLFQFRDEYCKGNINVIDFVDKLTYKDLYKICGSKLQDIAKTTDISLEKEDITLE